MFFMWADSYPPCLLQVDKSFNAVSLVNPIDVIARGTDAATGTMVKPEFNNYDLEFTLGKS